MASPSRGEIWLVDLGMVAKVRPCLVLSIPADAENDRALVTLVPHTTSLRGSRFEVSVPARFLKPGAFDAQNLITIPDVKLIRRLGELTGDRFKLVIDAVRKWLGLDDRASYRQRG